MSHPRPSAEELHRSNGALMHGSASAPSGEARPITRRLPRPGVRRCSCSRARSRTPPTHARGTARDGQLHRKEWDAIHDDPASRREIGRTGLVVHRRYGEGPSSSSVIGEADELQGTGPQRRPKSSTRPVLAMATTITAAAAKASSHASGVARPARQDPPSRDEASGPRSSSQLPGTLGRCVGDGHGVDRPGAAGA